MKIARSLGLLLGFFSMVLLAQAEPGKREFKPLDELILAPDFWTQTKEQFGEKMKSHGFEWVSEAQQEARAAVPGLKFADLGVVEALVRFDAEGKPQGAGVSFYTRGDAEDALGKEEFGALIKDTQEKLNAKLAVKPELLKSDNTSAVPVSIVRWTLPAAVTTLEWSFTREVKTRGVPFRAEFLRLQYSKPAEKVNLLQESLTRLDQGKKTNVARTATKEPNGDVWLPDVPMVDQGEKGYCVVAATERVMRYYGKEVDQHELAQMANSSAAEGTSSNAMVQALKSLTQKMMIKVRTLEQPDVKSITDMIDDYNRQAKKNKKPEVQVGMMISLDDVYGQMDPDTLKEARVKSRSDFGRWQTAISKHIQQGVPVMWTVMVGLYPEEKLGQGRGGHMRLIIGYNEKDQKIIYSDTWGLGHERKELPMDQAFAMTTGLYTIEPL